MTMQMIASCTNIMLYKWQRIKLMCNEKDLPRCVAPVLWNDQAFSGVEKSGNGSYQTCTCIECTLWSGLRTDCSPSSLKAFTE